MKLPDLIEVDLTMYDSKVPRYLVLTGEIDLRMYLLEEIIGMKRSAIDVMIDEATGYDKELEQNAMELLGELRWLKAEYDKAVVDV